MEILEAILKIGIWEAISIKFASYQCKNSYHKDKVA